VPFSVLAGDDDDGGSDEFSMLDGEEDWRFGGNGVMFVFQHEHGRAMRMCFVRNSTARNSRDHGDDMIL